MPRLAGRNRIALLKSCTCLTCNRERPDPIIRAKLRAIAKASGVHMDVDVRTGHSYDTILEVAKEKDVNLIIIASHRPGLQDYFLGSTAAKVVRHANCSVLVVR